MLKKCAEFDYLYDANNQGTPEQHEKNRQLLKMLRTLADPIPETTVWPRAGGSAAGKRTRQSISNGDTDVRRRSLKEKRCATVRCGFLLGIAESEHGKRFRKCFQFEPSEAYRALRIGSQRTCGKS